MEQSLLGKIASALRGMGGAVQDPQFRSDVVGGLANALRGGLADVLPTGAGPIMARNRGLPEDPNYRNKMTDLGLAGLTVYHGSPYKFDKFDMSKIGTGEGAQAYGHGLYFAENPGVAKDYAKTLGARIPTIEINGQVITPPKGSIAEQALNLASGVTGANASNPFAGVAEKVSKYGKQMQNGDEILKQVQEWQRLGGKVGSSQNTYRVDLPDDQIAKMLDWDKPLSQQPENVRAAAVKRLDEIRALGGTPPQDPSGDWLHRAFHPQAGEQGFGQQMAAERMRAFGIPGIRYLDQGSRSTGKGTSNFVVFDDSLPKIIGRE